MFIIDYQRSYGISHVKSFWYMTIESCLISYLIFLIFALYVALTLNLTQIFNLFYPDLTHYFIALVEIQMSFGFSPIIGRKEE